VEVPVKDPSSYLLSKYKKISLKIIEVKVNLAQHQNNPFFCMLALLLFSSSQKDKK
jgi:hypothetical protein